MMIDDSPPASGRLHGTRLLVFLWIVLSPNLGQGQERAQITLGAGCFWGLEDTLSQIPGVIDTEVGFMGGERAFPSYREVMAGYSGHVEVVQVQYNPRKLSLNELLKAFFAYQRSFDLKTRPKGPGSQYQSIVFFHKEEQKRAYETFIQSCLEVGQDHIKATDLRRVSRFYPASAYHQDYYRKRTCQRQK
ncbi:MAG: peptide-methionine (S)-S-oxide reductase MsrA [Bacteroidota bacterium]